MVVFSRQKTHQNIVFIGQLQDFVAWLYFLDKTYQMHQNTVLIDQMQDFVVYMVIFLRQKSLSNTSKYSTFRGHIIVSVMQTLPKKSKLPLVDIILI